MIKSIFKDNFILIFALFFALPFFFLFPEVFGDKVDYKHILANGIETEATLIEGSERSSVSVNDVNYYCVDYYFFDENMVKHYGTTSESFSYYDLWQLFENETIMIKYDPKNFDSIEAFYNSSKDKGKNITTTFIIVFAIIDSILWLFAILKIKRNFKLRKILNVGKEFSAKVVKFDSNMVVNGVPRYKVYYNWISDTGESIQGVSPSIYKLQEAEALQNMRDIQIKAIGKDSVIISKPDFCFDNHEQVVHNHSAIQEDNQLKCDYCGHNITEKDTYCGNCGARVNIYK